MPLLAKPFIVLKSLILFASTLGLIRRLGAFLAALTTLVGLSLFFSIVFAGNYRHQALWLVFLISLYWLIAPRPRQVTTPVAGPTFVDRLSTAGTGVFVLFLLLQVPYAAHKIARDVVAPGAAMHSRANTMSSIIARHAELKEAVAIADPDYLLETLPYYVANPTYLIREERYGKVVHFTPRARLNLSLGDVLDEAQRLRAQTGRPVMILLSEEVDPSLATQVYPEAYDWKFVITPEQARSFQLTTRLVEHHLAPADSDEDYYVYVMDK
jgi:hypothetical protein